MSDIVRKEIFIYNNRNYDTELEALNAKTKDAIKNIMEESINTYFIDAIEGMVDNTYFRKELIKVLTDYDYKLSMSE